MREIGGYIELDTYFLPMLHDGAVALNCGRNGLAYLIKAHKIKKILIPLFLCDSVREVCIKEDIEYKYYSIDKKFLPKNITLEDGEWLYVVNFYGQIENDEIADLKKTYERIIVDNVQAYYQMPVEHVDTIYTCRKYFGVSDGAFVYTDTMLEDSLEMDESFDRMRFLHGRFERTASEFYGEYVSNNDLFYNEPIKKMSRLTYNLLHGIDYEFVRQRRNENFQYLHESLNTINVLNLKIPDGPFMYPFYVENGDIIRKKLQEKKIYIPTLWPDVFDCCTEQEWEYKLAKNVLPLPIDQRYSLNDMKYLKEEILKCMNI